jgi:threonine/homoserine/homoserine lactone efflux protein
MSLWLLFSTSFLVGFSGAMMPGPMFTATVSESLRRGFRTGPLVVLGHGLIESLLVLALAAGIGPFISTPAVTRVIGLMGGAVLVLMGLQMALQGRKLTLAMQTDEHIAEVVGPVLAGVWSSASNPYFYIWWATIGLSFITEARLTGAHAIGIFYAGHLLSDFVWFGFVAWMIARGRRFFSDRLFHAGIITCGIALIGLGGWFILGASLLR